VSSRQRKTINPLSDIRQQRVSPNKIRAERSEQETDREIKGYRRMYLTGMGIRKQKPFSPGKADNDPRLASTAKTATTQ